MSARDRVPPGFVERRASGRWLLVRRDLESALLVGGLDDPESLTRHVRRGAVARLAAPAPPAVVRPYRRGGLLRRLDLPHRTTRRFRREVLAALAARARGLPVPEPLGAAARRAGAGWRGFVVYREVPESRDLCVALRGSGGGRRAAALLRRVLDLLRAAHDAGLVHPDLSLGNVLVEGDESRLWLVDLDRARLGRPRSARGRFADVSRLDRSIEKRFGGGLLGREARDQLIVGYAQGRPGLERFFRSRLAAHARRLARHRRLWGSGAAGPSAP